MFQVSSPVLSKKCCLATTSDLPHKKKSVRYFSQQQYWDLRLKSPPVIFLYSLQHFYAEMACLTDRGREGAWQDNSSWSSKKNPSLSPPLFPHIKGAFGTCSIFFWKPYAGKNLHDLSRPQKKNIYFSKVTRLIWSILFFFFLFSFALRPTHYYIPQQTDVPLSWPFFSLHRPLVVFRGWEKKNVSEGRWIIALSLARLHFLAAATHANMPDAKWGGEGEKRTSNIIWRI